MFFFHVCELQAVEKKKGEETKMSVRVEDDEPAG